LILCQLIGLTEIEEQSKNLNVCLCGCGQLCKNKYVIHHNLGKGKTHLSWNGGKWLTDHGYIKIYKPDHKFANVKGYVYEHRLVYEEHFKCCLLPYTVIHHIDGNRINNRIENLKPYYNNQHSSIEMMGNQNARKYYFIL
jgi:hypothetical protein